MTDPIKNKLEVQVSIGGGLESYHVNDAQEGDNAAAGAKIEGGAALEKQIRQSRFYIRGGLNLGGLTGAETPVDSYIPLEGDIVNYDENGDCDNPAGVLGNYGNPCQDPETTPETGTSGHHYDTINLDSISLGGDGLLGYAITNDHRLKLFGGATVQKRFLGNDAHIVLPSDVDPSNSTVTIDTKDFEIGPKIELQYRLPWNLSASVYGQATFGKAEAKYYAGDSDGSSMTAAKWLGESSTISPFVGARVAFHFGGNNYSSSSVTRQPAPQTDFEPAARTTTPDGNIPSAILQAAEAEGISQNQLIAQMADCHITKITEIENDGQIQYAVTYEGKAPVIVNSADAVIQEILTALQACEDEACEDNAVSPEVKAAIEEGIQAGSEKGSKKSKRKNDGEKNGIFQRIFGGKKAKKKEKNDVAETTTAPVKEPAPATPEVEDAAATPATPQSEEATANPWGISIEEAPEIQVLDDAERAAMAPSEGTKTISDEVQMQYDDETGKEYPVQYKDDGTPYIVNDLGHERIISYSNVVSFE